VAKPRADIKRFGYRFDTRALAPAIIDGDTSPILLPDYLAAEQREMLAEARSAA
jgi:hypothetical protein